MPSLRQLLVDAAAVVLVGIGLTAATRGYLHNLPVPAAVVQLIWEEPLTTGSIPSPTTQPDAAEPAPPRPWTDPPFRSLRASRYHPS